MRQLKDKVVVLTGAGGGIGSELARHFADAGSVLALLDIDSVALEELAGELRASGARVSTHTTDVRHVGELELARDEVVAAHGHADVLVNNAGVTVFSAFEDTNRDEIERVLGINLWGVIHACRMFLPALRQRPEAHIVNVSSEAGLTGMPWQSIYCASKFAVRGFTSSLRAELVDQGIGVTCVMPGATRSGIVSSAGSRQPQLTASLGSLLATHGFPPEWLARKVLRAIRWNRPELHVGPDAAMIQLATRVSPALLRGAMRGMVWAARRRGLGSSGERE